MKKAYETPSLIVEWFNVNDPEIIASLASDITGGEGSGDIWELEY